MMKGIKAEIDAMRACKTCGKRNCMEHGGEIKGVHKPLGPSGKGGQSDAGNDLMSAKEPYSKPGSAYSEHARSEAKRKHADVLTESRSMPAPKLQGLAEGGEVDMDPDHDGDEELHHMVAGELMDAIEKKDKAGIVDAIRALVMSCGGKV